MSKICGNSVCNKDQGTEGCVSAEWCPYYISTEPAVARTETIILPKSKWMTTNRIEPPKEDQPDDYDPCYECGGYGDDYRIDEDGELVSNCPDCPFNKKEDA